jgi:predicted N-acyltransferase
VEIEFAKEPSFLDDYWAMTESLYAKQGRRSPIPRHYLEAVWNTFSHSGKLQVLIAHHEGKRVAGAMFLTDGRTMYYLNGASFPHLNHLCANNLIQWRILQWAVETTIPLYDMVGAGMLQIARFKESFGAVPAFLPTARRTTSLLATASLQGYLRFAPTIRHLLFRVQREHVPHQLSPEGMSDPASDRVPAR